MLVNNITVVLNSTNDSIPSTASPTSPPAHAMFTG